MSEQTEILRRQFDPEPLGRGATVPRWVALGLPEDAPPINAYVRINGDAKASDDGRTPEHPGPSLAAMGNYGMARTAEKPPSHFRVVGGEK